jgi:hypothetical protein
MEIQGAVWSKEAFRGIVQIKLGSASADSAKLLEGMGGSDTRSTTAV